MASYTFSADMYVIKKNYKLISSFRRLIFRYKHRCIGKNENEKKVAAGQRRRLWGGTRARGRWVTLILHCHWYREGSYLYRTVLKSVISQRRSTKQQRRSRPGVDAQTLKEPPKTNISCTLNKYLVFKYRIDARPLTLSGNKDSLDKRTISHLPQA